MSKNDGDDEYEVGYGKPPKKTQWQPGQSGNPSGKKKKSDSLMDILQRLAGHEIVVQKNGVPLAMSQAEAMLTAVFAKAMKGDLACARFIHGELGIAGTPGVRDVAHSLRAGEVTPSVLSVLKSRADWAAIVEEAEARLEKADNMDEDEDEPE